MQFLNHYLQRFFGLEPYILLPLIMLVIGVLFRLKIKDTLQACIKLGIGFSGLFLIFNFFAENAGVLITHITARTGVQLSMLDAGWPFLASIAWSYRYIPLFILAVFVLNFGLVYFRIIRTITIDIWNLWEMLLVAMFVTQLTGNSFLGFGAGIVTFLLAILLADLVSKPLGVCRA